MGGSDDRPEGAVAPWEDLADLIDAGGDPRSVLAKLSGSDAVLAVSRLTDDMRTRLFTRLRPDHAAGLVEQMPDVAAIDIVESLEPAAAARIIHELPSDEQADLIGELDTSDADAILANLEPGEASDVRALAAYDDDEAGGLMVTEFLAYPDTACVAEVVDDLRANRDTYADYEVQYAYVVDAASRLVGVMPLRDLLMSSPDVKISELMICEPLLVGDHASIEEVQHVFDEFEIVGLPVVDGERRLVGVVHGAALDTVSAERRDNDYRLAQGIVGGEELRTMPLVVRSRRRLMWLSLNILLNIVAASVISAFEATLEAVIALAVFLPIISDMSGCSGNQAVAVSIRELSLGYVRPGEVLRVWGKEVGVGIINGTVLGTLIATVAWLWKGNGVLGLVVGGAMMLNTVVAVSIGGLVPLVLKRFGKDPALASGPILTTVTDMCGFFFVLGFATMLLEHLR